MARLLKRYAIVWAIILTGLVAVDARAQQRCNKATTCTLESGEVSQANIVSIDKLVKCKAFKRDAEKAAKTIDGLVKAKNTYQRAAAECRGVLMAQSTELRAIKLERDEEAAAADRWRSRFTPFLDVVFWVVPVTTAPAAGACLGRCPDEVSVAFAGVAVAGVAWAVVWEFFIKRGLGKRR